MEPTELSEQFGSKLSDLNNNPASLRRPTGQDLTPKCSHTVSHSTSSGRARDPRSAHPSLSLSLPKANGQSRSCIMNCSKDYLTKELSDVEIQRRLRNLVNIINNDQRIRNLDSKQLRINSHHHNLIEGNLCLHSRNLDNLNIQTGSRTQAATGFTALSQSGDQEVDKMHPSDRIDKMNGKRASYFHNYSNNENASVVPNRHRLSEAGKRAASGRQSMERAEDNANDSGETVRGSKSTCSAQSRVTSYKVQTALSSSDESDRIDATDDVNRIDAHATKCHRNVQNQVMRNSSPTNRKPANDAKLDLPSARVRSDGAHSLEDEDRSSGSFVNLGRCSESACAGDGCAKESFNKFDKAAFLPAAQCTAAPNAMSRDQHDSVEMSSQRRAAYNGAFSSFSTITNIGSDLAAADPETRSKLNEQRTSAATKPSQSSGRIPPPCLVNSSGEIYIEHPGLNVVFSLYNSSVVRSSPPPPPKSAKQLAVTKPQLSASISEATERQFNHPIDKAHLQVPSIEEAPTCARQPPGRKLDQQTAVAAKRCRELSHPTVNGWCGGEQMPVPNGSSAPNTRPSPNARPLSGARLPPNTRPPFQGPAESQCSPDDELAAAGDCAQGSLVHWCTGEQQFGYQTNGQQTNFESKRSQAAVEQRNANSPSKASCEQTSDGFISDPSSVRQLAACAGSSNLAAASNLTASGTASDSCMQASAAHVRRSSSETRQNIRAQTSVSSRSTSARESCRSSKSLNSRSSLSCKQSAAAACPVSTAGLAGSSNASCSGAKSATLKCANLKCSSAGGESAGKCARCPFDCAESQTFNSSPDCQSSWSPPNAGNMSSLSIDRLTCADDDEELIVELENTARCSPSCVQTSESLVRRNVQSDNQRDSPLDSQRDSPRDAQSVSPSDSSSGYHHDQLTCPAGERQQLAAKSSDDPVNVSQLDESSSNRSKQQLYINTNGLLHQNTNGLTSHPHSSSSAANGLTSQLPPQQSPSATSSTASSLSLPVDMDSIDDGIHLNSVPEPKQSRDYRTHEEFVYAMKEDLAEWFNNMYDDLQLNVHNFMDQVGTGVIICK